MGAQGVEPFVSAYKTLSQTVENRSFIPLKLPTNVDVYKSPSMKNTYASMPAHTIPNRPSSALNMSIFIVNTPSLYRFCLGHSLAYVRALPTLYSYFLVVTVVNLPSG